MIATEGKVEVSREELQAAIDRYLHSETAEQQLRALLERLPSRRVVFGSGDDCLTIETSYDPGTVRVVRGVMDLR